MRSHCCGREAGDYLEVITTGISVSGQLQSGTGTPWSHTKPGSRKATIPQENAGLGELSNVTIMSLKDIISRESELILVPHSQPTLMTTDSELQGDRQKVAGKTRCFCLLFSKARQLTAHYDPRREPSPDTSITGTMIFLKLSMASGHCACDRQARVPLLDPRDSLSAPLSPCTSVQSPLQSYF